MSGVHLAAGLAWDCPPPPAPPPAPAVAQPPAPGPWLPSLLLAVALGRRPLPLASQVKPAKHAASVRPVLVLLVHVPPGMPPETLPCGALWPGLRGWRLDLCLNSGLAQAAPCMRGAAVTWCHLPCPTLPISRGPAISPGAHPPLSTPGLVQPHLPPWLLGQGVWGPGASLRSRFARLPALGPAGGVLGARGRVRSGRAEGLVIGCGPRGSLSCSWTIAPAGFPSRAHPSLRVLLSRYVAVCSHGWPVVLEPLPGGLNCLSLSYQVSFYVSLAAELKEKLRSEMEKNVQMIEVRR